MDVAELVNEPNMGRHEATFVHQSYITHRYCQKWRSPVAKQKHREPMFTRVNEGPIRCELCGRRASRELKKIVEGNSEVYKCQELINCDKEVTLSFFTFSRQDLKDLGAWGLSARLSEELL